MNLWDVYLNNARGRAAIGLPPPPTPADGPPIPMDQVPLAPYASQLGTPYSPAILDKMGKLDNTLGTPLAPKHLDQMGRLDNNPGTPLSPAILEQLGKLGPGEMVGPPQKRMGPPDRRPPPPVAAGAKGAAYSGPPVPKRAGPPVDVAALLAKPAPKPGAPVPGKPEGKKPYPAAPSRDGEYVSPGLGNISLQPLLSLIDTWTGSNMAPGYRPPPSAHQLTRENVARGDKRAEAHARGQRAAEEEAGKQMRHAEDLAERYASNEAPVVNALKLAKEGLIPSGMKTLREIEAVANERDKNAARMAGLLIKARRELELAKERNPSIIDANKALAEQRRKSGELADKNIQLKDLDIANAPDAAAAKALKDEAELERIRSQTKKNLREPAPSGRGAKGTTATPTMPAAPGTTAAPTPMGTLTPEQQARLQELRALKAKGLLK